MIWNPSKNIKVEGTLQLEARPYCWVLGQHWQEKVKNVGLLEGGGPLLDFMGSHYRFRDDVFPMCLNLTRLCTIHIGSFPCLCNYHICFWDTGKRARTLKCVVGHPSLGHPYGCSFFLEKKGKKTTKWKKKLKFIRECWVSVFKNTDTTFLLLCFFEICVYYVVCIF